MSTGRRIWLVARLALGPLGGCNQVFDIQDAAVDPRLTAAGYGSTTAADHAGAGGMASVAGTGNGAAPTGGHVEHPAKAGSGGDGSTLGGDAGAEASAGDTGSGGTGGSGGSGGTGAMGGAAGKDSGQGAGRGGSATHEQGGNGGTPAPTDPCDDYCNTMDTACTGEALQYRDHQQCETICRMLPAGTTSEGAGDDDTIACRLKYLEKTRYGNGTEVTNYCREAGPSGEGKCGSACDAFCTLMMQVCTADTAGANHFATTDDCLSVCNGLPPASVHYSSSDPLVSDGNHALCRLFHVSSAAMADPDEHCEHAMGITLCEASP